MFQKLLPRAITPHDVVLWLDGLDGGYADRRTKTAYTAANMTKGVNINNGLELVFNGTSSKITCGDISVGSTKLVKSVSFWCNPTTATEYFIDFDGSIIVSMTNNAIVTTGWTSPTVYVNGVAQTEIKAGVWNFVTVTSDTGIDASAVVIGSIGSDFLEGSMTNIIFYTKTLSAIQHGQLYSTKRVGNSDLINGLLDQGNLTFAKQYSTSQSSVDADYSVGSGTGTWTVTRGATTPATYVDSSGVIQLKIDQTPRFTQGFYDSTGFVSRPGIILEGASTNLLVRTDGTASGSGLWTGWTSDNTGLSGTIVKSQVAIPELTGIASANAQRIHYDGLVGDVGATSNNALNSTNTAVGSVAAGNIVTLSFWYKFTSVGCNTIPLIAWRDSGGSLLSTSNGGPLPQSTTWKKFYFSGTAPASTSLINVKFPAGNADISNGDTFDLQVWGVQAEISPFATTFIPTTTTALTRNPETLTYPISGNRTAATESLFVKHTPPFNNTQNTSLYYITSTETKSRTLFYSAAGDDIGFAPNITDSAAVLIRSGAATGKPVAGTAYVITGVAYGPTGNPNSSFYIDGTSYDSSTNANTDWTTPAWGTYFEVGQSGGVGFGIISSIAIFSDAKSATNVLSISNLMSGS